MVIILYQDVCEKIAEKVSSDLITAFSDHVKVELMAADLCSTWPTDASWDDLLIVLYDGSAFPDAGNLFITHYLEQRPHSAMLLPVTIDPTSKKPPQAEEAIKALEYDHAAEGPRGSLANRVGAMLCLRVQ